MKPDKGWKNDKIVYIMAALLGVAAFIGIYGINVLNPVYDDWLLGQGDLSQHYLGWCFFRRGSWTFPVGLTNNLAYPSYTSVIFTDSIPLLAVFFKVLSPVLPDTFQYFGWWGAASFALQGFFAARILRELSVGKIQALVGSLFFIMSPIAIQRMFYHTALGGHWIILASIFLLVRHRAEYQNTIKTSVLWGVVGALVASIHMYFLPMCGALLCGYILCSLLRDRGIRWKRLLPGVSFVGMLFLSTYLLGGFSTRASLRSDGLGRFSFNLNGFFNAMGYSRFLDGLPTYGDGQYEGFAYLGIGIFVLSAAAFAFLVVELTGNRGRGIRRYSVELAAGLLIAVGLIMFAASPDVTWNDRLLFVLTDSSTLTGYWSIFGSTGRMVWPVYYLIYTAVLVCSDRLWARCIKNQKAAAAVSVVLLSACCFLQIFDISGRLSGQRERFAPRRIYESTLQDEVWDRLSGQDGLRHFIYVSNHYDNRQIMEMAKWAYDNGMTMNIFYFARGIGVFEDTQYSLQHPDDTDVFVLLREDLPEYQDCGLHFYEAGEYVVGTVFALE